MASLINALRQPSVTNQPPDQAEIRRNDIITILWFIFALFLGLGIRNNAVNTHRTVALGDNLPSIAIPSGWITGTSDGFVLSAQNPNSPSIFNAQVTVIARDLNNGENLVAARTGWSLQRSQQLLRYRELSAASATVLDNQPAVLVHYAYVADPTRDAGAAAPPVVVQAEDLMFISGNKFVVVTTAADAAEQDAESSNFAIVKDSLKLKLKEGEQP